ncbi:putative secondary metabolism biosynthetic enzyme [Knufia obscura]|uniref:Secondary metabolism biosynthetic enzyme n=2 Tax=Knufia TaxID=430999 RepID=A0AAN8I5E0_9EURO|nr:putative secondary metabolism biosynthetic enzyme [Knufia obscura]KAK5950975.1 putative secondary metabolism biosynthetic enzyme [Knufia fluminis]
MGSVAAVEQAASEVAKPAAKPNDVRSVELKLEAPTKEDEVRSMALKYFPEFNVQQYVVIVTGGGRGLGLTMAEALYQAGAIGMIAWGPHHAARGTIGTDFFRTVHCLDRLPEPEEEFLRVQKQEHRIPGGAIEYHSIDIRDTYALQKLIAVIAERYSRLDGVIAAAGIQKITSALEYKQQDVEDMLAVNYTAAFMTAQEVGKQMIRFKTPGSIVMIASISGQIANKGLQSPIYNSSKAAVIQLSKNLAMEWGKHGIRVNALCPGHILTPMVKANFEEQPDLEETWNKEIMLHRLSSPNEFRSVAIFLLSQGSSFMTGASINIDGGQTAW